MGALFSRMDERVNKMGAAPWPFPIEIPALEEQSGGYSLLDYLYRAQLIFPTYAIWRKSSSSDIIIASSDVPRDWRGS